MLALKALDIEAALGRVVKYLERTISVLQIQLQVLRFVASLKGHPLSDLQVLTTDDGRSLVITRGTRKSLPLVTTETMVSVIEVTKDIGAPSEIANGKTAQ